MWLGVIPPDCFYESVKCWTHASEGVCTIHSTRNIGSCDGLWTTFLSVAISDSSKSKLKKVWDLTIFPSAYIFRSEQSEKIKNWNLQPKTFKNRVKLFRKLGVRFFEIEKGKMDTSVFSAL